jgi:16S rRNA (guanine1516-N2)-methyltransferase
MKIFCQLFSISCWLLLFTMTNSFLRRTLVRKICSRRFLSSTGIGLSQKVPFGVADQIISKDYQLPFYSPSINSEDNFAYILRYNASNKDILEIYSTENKKMKPFYLDFLSGQWNQRRKEAKSELVTKAFGKTDIIIDFTAGIGRDSMILASSGKKMILFEQNIILFLLLQNALQRFFSVHPSFQERIQLHYGKAQSQQETIQTLLSVSNSNFSKVSVYLDPMYPESMDERKAKVKKETQMIHALLKASNQHYSNETEFENEENNRSLFETAKQVANDRIVVKRDLSGLSLQVPEKRTGQLLLPHSKVMGSNQRFDIYFINQLS